MDLQQLRGFFEVAREGSFTRAANKLFVTQPAISQQLKALEAEIGDRLIERRRKSLRLTPAGEILFRRTRSIFSELDGAIDEIDALKNVMRGMVTIGTSDTNCMYVLPPVLDRFRGAFPEAEIVNADNIMTSLRQIKSPAELACLREGFRISEAALDVVLDNIKAGMTELQAVGIIQKALYENGAEYESHPVYVLSAGSTAHAISRPTHRTLEPNDMVQLNLGGRVDGYSPSVGRPICLGKMTPRRRELVEFGLEAHHKTCGWMKAGVVASEVAKKYEELFRRRGYQDAFLYGPCHGLGMIEVEKPWMETVSDYPLAENMTFQVDTFLQDGDFGLRWENGVRVAANGVEMLSQSHMEIIELG